MKVVCFSEIQWLYVRTRKQQILSRFPDDWEILFLSSVVKGKRNNFLPESDGRVTHVCVPVFKNFPHKSLRILFSVPVMRFLWNVLIYVWLNVIFLVTGFNGRRRVFYVSNIYYAAVLPFLPRTLLIYDCNDDHLSFPNTPGWAAGYFRKLSLSADAVVAVSTGLVRRLESSGVSEIDLIGNGVDYELFEKAASAGTPDELEGLPRPLIGYSGAVAPWFDFELLDMVASSFPRASIVLAGPVFEAGRGEMKAIAQKRKNIHHLGSKPYEELGAYIAAMDVCIIPLKVNELMRLADPNKLYEYAAAGKPIVTMKYSQDLEALGEHIHLAESREEFVEKIRLALSHGADGAWLRDFARRSSWRARAEAMTSLIECKLKEKE